MQIQIYFFSLLLSLLPIGAIAGADHDHGHDHDNSHSHEPVSQPQAEQAALKSVGRLVEKGKIDSSWKTVKASKTEKKKFGDKLEWVVTLKNSKIGDTKKQTLYVFLSLSGEYIAANYTGK